MISHKVEPLTPEQAVKHLEYRLGSDWHPDRIEQISNQSSGNLNVVYIVSNRQQKVVLKQGLPYVRIARDWKLTAQRTCREAEFYRKWGQWAPGLVPSVHDLDEAAHVLVMEFIENATPWREELAAARLQAGIGSQIGVSLARTAFHSSAIGLSSSAFEAEMARAANPEMEALMEDVLFYQPWRDHARNDVPEETADLVASLRQDETVQRRIGELHAIYRFRREVLSHGDLHSGSVMTGSETVRVFDGEFSRYAPASFDLGALWGSLILAAVGSRARGHDCAADVLAVIADIWDCYRAEMLRLWPRHAINASDTFIEPWLDSVKQAAIGFAGIEAGRRIIGIGKVEDTEALPAPARAEARRAALRESRTWLATTSTDLGELIGASSRRLAS